MKIYLTIYGDRIGANFESVEEAFAVLDDWDEIALLEVEINPDKTIIYQRHNLKEKLMNKKKNILKELGEIDHQISKINTEGITDE